MSKSLLAARLRPIGRVALVMANTQVADRVASEWGECVWTAPTLWRIRAIEETNLLRVPMVAWAEESA